MHQLVPGLKTTIIPNAAGEDLLEIYQEQKNPEPVFLYIGNYSWLQNVEGARILIDHIFPLIRKEIPEATCIIAGQRADEKIGKVNSPGIEIIDIASSDTDKVVEVFTKGSIFLAPLEGPGGTRLKILGAMAAGMPVVSSKTGVSGLEVKHGKHAYIAHTYEEFARYAISLLKDPKKYADMRTDARALVDNVYSWNGVSQKLEKIYTQLTTKKS